MNNTYRMTDQRIISGSFSPCKIIPKAGGNNNKFVLQCLREEAQIKLKIFNRWGSVIYESANYENNWDGKEVVAGTYYYEVSTITKSSKSNRGWIVVIK